ncbi:hypothetical protein [Halalkalibacillus halophilus]|uniref:hypothetical protein n=1 Tax=Halalkalibacillus halophilus TaxID=392827 RepID=UPI000425951D|nr:hypothetical protein [Halalkalibacillus halophilus]
MIGYHNDADSFNLESFVLEVNEDELLVAEESFQLLDALVMEAEETITAVKKGVEKIPESVRDVSWRKSFTSIK